MADSKPVFAYWGIRGLGQTVRILAAYLDLELNEKRYTSKEEWEAEKHNLDLAFPNLPYLIDGEVRLTESRAIIKHLAREHSSSLYPTSSDAARTCDMLENVLYDVWTGLLRHCFYDLDTTRGSVENDTPKKMQYINSFLEKKKYILGDQISYVDFILYEMLVHFTSFESTYLEKYPALLAFKKAFEEIPLIAKYFASSQYIKGPCIPPFAKIPI